MAEVRTPSSVILAGSSPLVAPRSPADAAVGVASIRRRLRLTMVIAIGLMAALATMGSASAQPARGPVEPGRGPDSVRSNGRTQDKRVQPANFTQPSFVPESSRNRVAVGEDENSAPPAGLVPAAPLGWDPAALATPQGFSAAMRITALLTVLSLAPSILMMTTCFIRFVVVLGLLRQALGTQQLPPNQVLVSLALFMTFMVMTPVWNRSYNEGIRPYTNPLPGEAAVDEMTALTKALVPLREFMADQIDRADNAEIILMFLDFQKPSPGSAAARAYTEPGTYADVPTTVLLPSYLLSELKVAFLIGFQVYLPFLIIDMVISAVLISMGMMMLPPVLISLPFKLLLFVMIDGWFLTVGMLLESVRPMG